MQMTVREEDVCVIRMIKLLTADEEEGELRDDEDDKKQRTSPFAEFNWFPSLSLTLPSPTAARGERLVVAVHYFTHRNLFALTE